MPKTFPLAVKERALELYLQGSSPKDVSEVLRNEFTNDVTQSTVYAWVKQEGWEEKKNLVYAESLIQIQETEGQKINRIQQEHWDDYGKLRHKAYHELDLLQFEVVNRGKLFCFPFILIFNNIFPTKEIKCFQKN